MNNRPVTLPVGSKYVNALAGTHNQVDFPRARGAVQSASERTEVSVSLRSLRVRFGHFARDRVGRYL